jgi:hypothetical protein
MPFECKKGTTAGAPAVPNRAAKAKIKLSKCKVAGSPCQTGMT